MRKEVTNLQEHYNAVLAVVKEIKNSRIDFQDPTYF